MRSPQLARMANPGSPASYPGRVQNGWEPVSGLANPGLRVLPKKTEIRLGKSSFSLNLSPTPAPSPRSHQIGVAHKAGSNTAALVPLTSTLSSDCGQRGEFAPECSRSLPCRGYSESTSWHPSFLHYRTIRCKALASSCPPTVETLSVLVFALVSCQVSRYGATSPDISISSARLTVAPQ